MNFRNGTSLRRRVVLVILATSAAALLLAGGTFIAYDLSTFRVRLVSELSSQAAIVGENARAPLLFQDRAAAERTLATLTIDPQVRTVALYSADGRLFASVRAGSDPADAPPPLAGEGYAWSGGRLRLFRPVRDGSEIIGAVFVVSDLGGFEQHVRGYSSVAVGVLIVALLFAALLAYYLQRLISGPILRLAAATRKVAGDRDYAVRVPAERDDELGHLVGSFNEMLRQIQVRDGALRESEERYALAIRGAQDGIWDWNLSSGEIFYSQRWKEMVGYRDDEIAPRAEEWLSRIHDEDFGEVRRRLDAHIAGASSQFEHEYRLHHRDGNWLWVFSRGLAVRDASGRATRIAGSQSDVTPRKGRDALTGLPNRLLFVDRLEVALARSRGSNGPQCAVLCIDFERLGLINDTLGRGAGRDLLLTAAERILPLLQPNDTLARLEGGEFAVLLEQAPDATATAASRVAAAIHTEIAPSFHLLGQEIFTTAAIGIATSASGYPHAEEALRDAETALDRARTGGWNRTELFDEQMRVRAFARLDLESALRRAIDRDELELHYQPIVSLATGERRLAGFEALVRWQREAGKHLPPMEFISLAEETGLIIPLGNWVLRRTCRQLQEWRERYPELDRLSISVNVSGRQLAWPDLVNEVGAALGEARLPAARLKLEITENALIERPEMASGLLHELEGLNVGIWLDDFGTGYSSLSHLCRFPIEVIKIDRSFVGAVDGNPDRRAIVRSIVSLARSLGLATVAEGVETESQIERVTELDCDFAQGHAISRPLSPADAEALLQAARV